MQIEPQIPPLNGQQQYLPPNFVPVGFVTPQPNGSRGNVTIITPQGGQVRITQSQPFGFQPQGAITTPMSMSTFVCKYKQAKEGIVVCFRMSRMVMTV